MKHFRVLESNLKMIWKLMFQDSFHFNYTTDMHVSAYHRPIINKFCFKHV